MLLSSHTRRRAATAVECAVVLPLTFFLFLGLVIGVSGVFRYQEVSTLARDGARYASTHGYQFRKDSGQTMGTPEDWRKEIYDKAIKPKMVGLDPDKVTVIIAWPDVINQKGKPDNWPGSRVEVTVRYEWLPSMILAGPYILESTSSMPITN